jgi:hypothetical protein
MSTHAPSPNFLARVTSLTALLWLFVVVTQLINGLYFAREIEPPASYTLLYPLAFLWIIGLWMRRDCRKHGVRWALDMGLFLYIAWPFIMPYYLFKTRGLQGLLLVGAFMGVYLIALIAGMALSMLPTS